MFLILSKKVEYLCMKTAKVNNIDVVYIRSNVPTTIFTLYRLYNDFTNNFEKMPLLVTLLMHLLTTGGDG